MSAALTQRIQQNYSVEAMLKKIRMALQEAGRGDGPLQWNDLTSFNHFHVRGLEATMEMADDLQLKKGQAVLDVGSGLGGPARYLGAVHAVHVTGIDLTAQFVEISKYLSDRAGLSRQLDFREGEATDLPFPSEMFDVAWTQTSP